MELQGNVQARLHLTTKSKAKRPLTCPSPAATALCNQPLGTARAELALPATGTAAGKRSIPKGASKPHFHTQELFFQHTQQIFTQVLATRDEAGADHVSDSSRTALPAHSITREEDFKSWCDKTVCAGGEQTGHFQAQSHC